MAKNTNTFNVKKTIILNGKQTTLVGEDFHGFDVVEDPTAAGQIKPGPRNAYEAAELMGVPHRAYPLSHRQTLDENGLPEPKVEKKVRIFTDKEGRIVKSVAIEPDERKTKQLTDYKTDFTEEVFSGVAAPYINQGGTFFHAMNPGDWDLGAFRSASLDASFSTLNVPIPGSMFDYIDETEGTAGITGAQKSSFYTGTGTQNAPLRAVAQQQSTGVLCVSVVADFQATQPAITQVISILNNEGGFREGGSPSSRINFSGIRWAGMLQHDDAQTVSVAIPTGGVSTRTVSLLQTRDPAVIKPEDRNPWFRLHLIYYRSGPSDPGVWDASLLRMSHNEGRVIT